MRGASLQRRVDQHVGAEREAGERGRQQVHLDSQQRDGEHRSCQSEQEHGRGLQSPVDEILQIGQFLADSVAAIRSNRNSLILLLGDSEFHG